MNCNRTNATRSPPASNAATVPHRRFLTIPARCSRYMDLSVEDVSHLLVRATVLENLDPLMRDRILLKRRIALLFYESSTRTRTSFELAAKSLGADTTLVSSLSLEHRKRRVAERHRPHPARARR